MARLSQLEAVICVQDQLVQPLEFQARLDPQLFRQNLSYVPISGQGLGPAACRYSTSMSWA